MIRIITLEQTELLPWRHFGIHYIELTDEHIEDLKNGKHLACLITEYGLRIEYKPSMEVKRG